MNASPEKPDYSQFPTLTRNQARAAADELLALDGRGVAVSGALLQEIKRFYYREARLLDEERHDEWYELLADDLFYWAPLRENRYRRDPRAALDPASMALFDERKADIAVRMGRLASNLVWTEDPPTRHVYVVTNIEAFETARTGAYEVHSAFIQHRNRGERDESTIIGRRRDVIRSHGGGFQIARRLILLPQSVLLTKNLTAFF